LIGNVLPEWISFSEFPFPPPPSPTQPFPTLSETHAYLRTFSEPFLRRGLIRLNTEVVRVDEISSVEGGGWAVTFRDWSETGKGHEAQERWDAIVVATAFYDHPVWPEAEGLDEARDKGLVKHAKFWEGPKGYEGKVRRAFPQKLACVSP
jgi:cation diffusion facilitator CzcD-associated flavoprotein CzcO